MSKKNHKTVNLLIETKENSMLVTKSDLNPEQTVQLIQFLVDQLEKASGIDHNTVLEDLKYKEKKNGS